MVRLAFKLIALSLMVMIFVGIIVVIVPHDTNNYLAAARDKHQRLNSVKAPRIIFVGGSNLAFGIDSERIQNSFDLPVINMGLHGDVGLRFMLNEVQPVLREGDIVLLFPEYEHFYEISLDGLPRELGSVVKFCPECLSAVNTPGQLLNLAAGILQTSEGDLLRMIRRPEKPDHVYSRQAFNQWGDVVSHLEKADKLRPNNHVYEIEVSSAHPAIDLLNSFYESENGINAEIFFLFPAIPIDEYKAQEAEFLAVHDLILSDLKIPILGTPQDFVYPEDFFYDTVYHLNRVGRDARTDHVIELLSAALQD